MEIEEKKDEEIGEIKIDYFEIYFGKSKDYYLPKLIAFENGKKYSFNIGAFFFGIFWLLYRRLYVHSLIVFLVIFVESSIEKFLLTRLENTKHIQISLTIIWTILLGFVLGYLGNYFYLKHSKKKVENIISSTNDERKKIKKLKRSGSGNWILVLLMLLLFGLAVL